MALPNRPRRMDQGFAERRPAKKLSAEERFSKIQEAAFLIAEKDGFKGHPDSYWLAAEAEIQSKYPA